ncbi:clumping factor A-like [Panicum virgatum]|uniref:clumping factor A-like n=1 Tax=Panicum virgatum TaxID=38727 RepID=UPI0019D53E83|nr:clumping factor A-like [Panicum virgatum]
MDKDFADSIQEEKKFSKIRLDAYSLWKLLEAICEEDSNDEDQEEDEGSLEEYITSENHTHPLVVSFDDQGRKGAKSAGSLLELVRPRNREKRSKLNEDRVARAAGVGSSSSGTKAATVVSASQPLAAAPSQRQLRPRRAKIGAQQMEIDKSSDNDTEEDAPYLRDPRDDEDTETDADASADDANDDDDDDVDSDDGSEESAVGSSDLEGPVVTPAIQIPFR